MYPSPIHITSDELKTWFRDCAHSRKTWLARIFSRLFLQLFSVSPWLRILSGGHLVSFTSAMKKVLPQIMPRWTLSNQYLIGTGHSTTSITIVLRPEEHYYHSWDPKSFLSMSKSLVCSEESSTLSQIVFPTSPTFKRGLLRSTGALLFKKHVQIFLKYRELVMPLFEANFVQYLMFIFLEITTTTTTKSPSLPPLHVFYQYFIKF